jgi:hypothetical protein
MVYETRPVQEALTELFHRFEQLNIWRFILLGRIEVVLRKTGIYNHKQKTEEILCIPKKFS